MDDSLITRDEILEEIFPTNFNEKKWSVKHEVSIFYSNFY